MTADKTTILMMPFTIMAMWTFGEKAEIVWKSGRIAFCFSIGIEFLQLLLRLGTFQLSDIVYNTLGGCMGGLIYWLVMKLKEHSFDKTK